MKEQQIKAVIFDLGNVLIGFDHSIAVEKIIRHTKKTAREIYGLFFDSALTRDFEKGKTAPLAFFDKVKAALEINMPYPEFLSIWNKIFFPKPDILDLARELSRRLELAMLSNINQLHYEYLRVDFGYIFDLFHPSRIIASYNTGYIKPDEEIYDLAVSKCSVKKENILYVDDREDLIEAASGYGIRSCRYKNTRELRQEFINLKII